MNKRLITTISLFFIFLPIFSASAAGPIRILLVPGHDNDIWGAQYGNTKEADMNLAVATRIYDILKKDKRFEIHITREANGYTKEFADYFTLHRDEIIAFKNDAKKARQADIASGEFVEKENPPHNVVKMDTSVILYGINKWANENKMDAVIHIHFNDYPRVDRWTTGKHKGFVIYIPEGQMVNWKESGQLAADIFTQLHKKYITSTYEKELGGLTPDQTLIALGSNGTLSPSVRSILIEYGYIYRFKTSASRLRNYKIMASLTATGIKNYFFPN